MASEEVPSRRPYPGREVKQLDSLISVLINKMGGSYTPPATTPSPNELGGERIQALKAVVEAVNEAANEVDGIEPAPVEVSALNADSMMDFLAWLDVAAKSKALGAYLAAPMTTEAPEAEAEEPSQPIEPVNPRSLFASRM